MVKRRVHMVTSALVACALLLQCVPAVQANGPESFRLRLLVPEGDKIKERDVSVIFENRRMLVRSRETGLDLKVFSYENLKSAEYSYSTHPRWKTGAGAVGVFAIPLFFMKGKKHWLSIKAANDFGVLRLDKNNYKIVIAAFESHSKLKIEILGEEK